MTREMDIQAVLERRSRIVYGDGLSAVKDLLVGEEELFLVYDEKVSKAAGTLIGLLPEIKGSFALDAAEAEKQIETVLALCRQLLEADASRQAFLIALGGGFTTDVAGFAAAIYKRGIRYANIPTTLLAQADAAIGGKTGVNLDGCKNMLGAFHLPSFTFLCADVLATLPPRERRNGLAEVAKTLLIGDADAYADLLENGLSARSVFRAAEIKAAIVQKDPFEQGERAKLNLGHSFGHAIEQEALRTGVDLAHGEAVAMGILIAAEISERNNLAEKGFAKRLKAEFERIGLPVESPFPPETLLPALRKDKKTAGGKITLALPVKPGTVVLKAFDIHDLHFSTE